MQTQIACRTRACSGTRVLGTRVRARAEAACLRGPPLRFCVPKLRAAPCVPERCVCVLRAGGTKLVTVNLSSWQLSVLRLCGLRSRTVGAAACVQREPWAASELAVV